MSAPYLSIRRVPDSFQEPFFFGLNMPQYNSELTKKTISNLEAWLEETAWLLQNPKAEDPRWAWMARLDHPFGREVGGSSLQLYFREKYGDKALSKAVAVLNDLLLDFESLAKLWDQPKLYARVLKGAQEDLVRIRADLKRVLYDTPGKEGPGKFTWNGLKFWNYGWKERDVKKVLDSLSWLLDLFKRRGLEKVLLDNLREIRLYTEERSFDAGGKNYDEAGHYHIHEKYIALRHSALAGRPNVLQSWLAEIFLHELGHHVHLSYLPRDAKEFWDSGWQFVDEAEGKLRAEVLLLTPAQRKAIFEGVKDHDWDAAEYIRSLRPIERVRALFLFNHAGLSDESQTRLKLDKAGTGLLARIRQLEQVAKEEDHWFHKSRFETARDELKNKLLVDLPIDLEIEGIYEDYIRKIYPEADKAISDLGIPTEYGRINVMEDFAETFVQFMVYPERLSKPAKWRMGRTLGMSAAGGRPVMKLTKKASFDLTASLVELGYEKPELRPHLRPLLDKIGANRDESREILTVIMKLMQNCTRASKRQLNFFTNRKNKPYFDGPLKSKYSEYPAASSEYTVAFLDHIRGQEFYLDISLAQVGRDYHLWMRLSGDREGRLLKLRGKPGLGKAVTLILQYVQERYGSYLPEHVKLY